MLSPDSARILIVDDDSDTRSNLCDILELFGYVPSGVGSSAEALSYPELDSVAVILLDRRLPDMRAEEVLPKLRQRVPDTDIVIVTGHADLDSSIEALRLGAADYLLKPVNPDALRLAIERCLERKKLRREKQRSEMAFRQLVESAGSIITIVRPDHSIVYLNPFGERYTGRHLADVIGLNCMLVFLDEDSQQRVESAFQRVLSGHEIHDFEVGVRCHDGARRWMLCNARRLEDYDGGPAVLSIGHDITARREAEQGLYLLDAAIAHLEEGVLLTKAGESWFSSRIVYANAALATQVGSTPEELVGLTPVLFEGPRTDPFLMQKIDQALQQGHSLTAETYCQKKDGSEFPAELHLSPVVDPEGKRSHTVATVRDITLRRLAEERLLQAERLAAIGKAMTGLAHESRNALQRAQASLDMLASDLEGNEQATKLIRRIQVAQDDLHRLYEDVREYARPIRIEPHPHRMDELLRQSWDELILKRQQRETSLHEHSQTKDLSCSVEAFAIRQVFRNILDNSLAACDGTVRIDVTWSDAKLRDQSALAISIRDNGPGIGLEQRQHLFDEFYTTKTHGTGLGLAISRRFIEAHGGRIEAADSGPPGLELVITLPRGRPAVL